MTRGASWARVKSKLRRSSAPELLSVIQDLYRASPENRWFLHARFLPSEASLEEYRRRVVVAIFPAPLSRNPVRIGEAQRLIRQYRLSTGDQVGVVDLMLSMDEAGTEQAADVGYGDDAYFGSLERILRSVVEALPSLPRPAIPSIELRLRELARRSEAIGWEYGDTVNAITEPIVSPGAKPRARRRGHRV
jgi:hypothetical protein